jgi:hypothetical protein
MYDVEVAVVVVVVVVLLAAPMIGTPVLAIAETYGDRIGA